MASVEARFQGLMDGESHRNSSRVLAAPGGKSSFSFSDGSNEPQFAQRSRSSQQAHSKRNESHVFGSPAKNAAPAAANPPAPQSPSRKAAASEAFNVSAPTHGKTKSSFSAESGVSAPTNVVRDVKTSTRVHAPPGGHCHQIFF